MMMRVHKSPPFGTAIADSPICVVSLLALASKHTTRVWSEEPATRVWTRPTEAAEDSPAVTMKIVRIRIRNGRRRQA